MRESMPSLPREPNAFTSLVNILQSIVANRATIRLVAKFAYQTMSLYTTVPMYIPPVQPALEELND
jgi:hypothetical protein